MQQIRSIVQFLWAAIPLTSVTILTEEHCCSTPYSGALMRITAFYDVNLMRLKKLHLLGWFISSRFYYFKMKNVENGPFWFPVAS